MALVLLNRTRIKSAGKLAPRHLNQSDEKLKSTASWSFTFLCALGSSLLAGSSTSVHFLLLIISVAIYLWKALYHIKSWYIPFSWVHNYSKRISYIFTDQDPSVFPVQLRYFDSTIDVISPIN